MNRKNVLLIRNVSGGPVNVSAPGQGEVELQDGDDGFIVLEGRAELTVRAALTSREHAAQRVDDLLSAPDECNDTRSMRKWIDAACGAMRAAHEELTK